MRWVLIGCLVMGGSAGCTKGECVGVLRQGDKCVVVDPFDSSPPVLTVDPPLVTRFVGTVTLTSDEPATIYYTLDGQPATTSSDSGIDEVVIPNVPEDAILRYFAVDLLGNQSTEETRIWVIDRDGPATPFDFRLALAGNDRTLSWTPAEDLRPGGVVVARLDGRFSVLPESGRAYAVGEVISGAATVVAVSIDATPSTFSENLPTPPGLVRYVAWSFDSLFNYSATTGDYKVVPFPDQQQVQLDVLDDAVTVTTPPSVLGVTSSSSYDATAQQLTVTVTLTNATSRVVFSPKLVLTNTLPTNVVFSDPDGTTTDTFPFRHFGAGIAPGSSATVAMKLTGVAPATPVPLTLEIRDNHAISATSQDFSDNTAAQIADAATGVQVKRINAASLCPNGNGMSMAMAFTPDGRIVTGDRTAGTVSIYDAISGTRIRAAEVRPQRSYVPLLVLDRSGSTVYAVASANGRRKSIESFAGTDSELVRLDAANLTVTGRIPLGKSKNRNIELSPDGRTLAIATGVGQGVILVDVSKFVIARRIATTTFKSNAATFSPDSQQIALIGEQLQIFDLAGTPTANPVITPLDVDNNNSCKVVRAVWPAADKLWIIRGCGGIAKVDPTNLAATPFTDTTKCQLGEVFDGKLYTASCTFPQVIKVLDLDTGTELQTIAGVSRMQGHGLTRSPF
jgi:WD40 repeat protein